MANTTVQFRDLLHNFYTIPLAFSPQTVSSLIDMLGAKPHQTILDPFCGTGTTLLEAKARGIRSIGVDANPVCTLASRAKSDWEIDVVRVGSALDTVLKKSERGFEAFLHRYFDGSHQGRRLSPLTHSLFRYTREGKYLKISGLIDRGWISKRPALKALLLSQAISRLRDPRVRNFLMVGLMGVLVRRISNVKFGPEAYTSKPRGDVNVFRIYEDHVRQALEAISSLQHLESADGRVAVVTGDSMNGGITGLRASSVDFVITSPPYPAEHDYTRNTRLELVYGRFVTTLADLVRIKRRMIRCSSKGIYKDDKLSSHVVQFKDIEGLIRKLRTKAKIRSYGFARMYPRVVGEYFGGMYLHLKRLRRVLKPGARCAYIVGDQASFFGTHIHTAKLLTVLLESKECGFAVERVIVLRKRRATRGSHKGTLPEHVLIFRKNERPNHRGC